MRAILSIVLLFCSALQALEKVPLVGTVLNSDGSPAKNVEVTISATLYTKGGQDFEKTDEKGEVHFLIYPEASVSLNGVKLTADQGCIASLKGVKFDRGRNLVIKERYEPATPFVIQLGPKTCKIRGLITRTNGKPAANANVTLGLYRDYDTKEQFMAQLWAKNDEHFKTVTNAEGRFEIEGPPGKYRIECAYILTENVELYQTVPQPFMVENPEPPQGYERANKGDNIELHAQLKPAAGIEVRALTPEGKPATRLRAQTKQTTAKYAGLAAPVTVNAEGIAQLRPVFNTETEVRLMAFGNTDFLGTAFQKVQLKIGSVTRVDIPVLPGRVMQGRVLDENGAPINGAFVKCESLLSGRYTENDGQYKLTGIPLGPVKITASCRTGGPREKQTLEINPGEGGSVLEKNIVLRRVQPATISGTVSDDAGAVLINAIVLIHESFGEITGFTKTDDKGNFVLKDIAPGEYTLDVLPPRERTESLRMFQDRKMVLEPGQSLHRNVVIKSR